jgi:superfamily II DNA or RNA helicase
MNPAYLELLKSKKRSKLSTRKKVDFDPHPNAKPHQVESLRRLLDFGTGAAFLDTGLGKTFLQLDWARHVSGDVLILAPLAVAEQTVEESHKLLDMEIGHSKDGTVKDRITITNYERAHLFDIPRFSAVVLDESSILKGQTGKMRAWLTKSFQNTPWKLACTATPAPNDHTELGNHSEFLGVMNSQEMLTRWFIHDSANTADWRLKGHAVRDFWEWVGSWSVCVSMPSDLGFDDEGYALPPIKFHTHSVATPLQLGSQDELFHMPSVSATDLHATKRLTIDQRCQLVSEMVNKSEDPWIVWCESNDESALLAKLIPDAVEVKGSQTIEQKEERLNAFTNGKARVLISKPKICGFGMNWQHCRNMAFASISYSYESFYQAVRRSWRFGQTKQVNVHVFISDAEIPVWRTIERKALSHDTMKNQMRLSIGEGKTSKTKLDYNPTMQATLPAWL